MKADGLILDRGVVESARADAAGAARHAGLEVRSVDDAAGLRGVAAVFDTVWGGPPMLPLHMLQALAHAGNYAALAYAGADIVGASVGFLGRFADGEVLLHSHITGATEAGRRKGIGFALKQHQRAWALDRDIRSITWTFDPLVRRNAYFNLTKLGARATAYYADFYAQMDDAINAGDHPDRIFVTWRLDEPRVVACAKGAAAPVEPSAQARIALEIGSGGEPVVAALDGATAVLCRVPDDIVEVRRADAGLGLAWRLALRDTLGRALTDGYVALGVTGDGCYLLNRQD